MEPKNVGFAVLHIDEKEMRVIRSPDVVPNTGVHHTITEVEAQSLEIVVRSVARDEKRNAEEMYS